ncbi:MAG TPA: polysialyltransferase family glycosyltransferase [Amnibacterium sp.]|jgi:hypothetical protein|uniref:polysialyltransferase family glycosyltransferase n=1 Tax=Amnibacterium sp. TaxID=1872496 RepID=UPI002F93321D
MSPVTQIFEASASYQLMVLAAALDSGAFPPAERRILLTSSNSAVPEVAGRLEDDLAIAPLLSRFDSVASFNDLIFPLHPKGFRPPPDELPLFERAFRRELGIPDDHLIELVLESIQTPPARTILNVFAESPVTVYAEGLMSYGPTRDPLPHQAWARLQRLLHLDLVEGLEPILLSEYGVQAEVIDPTAFRAVVAELSGSPQTIVEPYALVLGQYLADLGLSSAEEEADLYRRCIDAAAACKIGLVLYKPHPSAPPSYTEALRRHAERRGIGFEVETDPLPAEVLYERRRPALVLGCFSTGIVTAARYWNIPVACTGTREVLASLPRFEDSNRIPLLLIDLTVPKLAVDRGFDLVPPPGLGVPALQRIVATIAYCMQWRARHAYRDDAVQHLLDRRHIVHAFVPRRRLLTLLLPGGVPMVVDGSAFRHALGLLVGLRARQLALQRGLRRLVDA